MSPQPASHTHLRLFSKPAECDAKATAADPPVADGAKLTNRSASIAAATPAADESSAKRVEVAVGEIAPLLADAIDRQLGWLQDFSNDTVSIDADLYEVLLAYQQMRRHSAA